jgi:hypothetical protein
MKQVLREADTQGAGTKIISTSDEITHAFIFVPYTKGSIEIKGILHQVWINLKPSLLCSQAQERLEKSCSKDETAEVHNGENIIDSSCSSATLP